MRSGGAMVGLALLAACGGDGANYTLALHPYAPIGESPFDGGPDVLLSLRDAARGVAFEPLGALSSGASSGTAEKLGALDATMVGLVLQDGTSGDFDPAAVRGFGEAGPFTVADGDAVDADVLVASVGGIGGLDVLDADHGALHAAIAVLPDGRTYLFGGAKSMNPSSGTAQATVQELRDLDAPSWSVEAVAGMPDYDQNGVADGLFGATATVVGPDDAPLIFVAGGRHHSAPIDGSTRDAGLFDPAIDDWAWTTTAMVGTRSDHQAVRSAEGVVFVVGGVSGAGVIGPATWEVFGPDSRSFRAAPGALGNSALGFAIAPLPAGGALVCGGGAYEGAGTASTTPQATCTRLAASGQATAAADLPVGAQLLAMAPLGDGRILACGGMSAAAEEGASAPAIDTAYIYDPASDAWTAAGSMTIPRAGHRAIPMPDGRVLIVGGVEADGLLSPARGAIIDCPEIYDPVTDAFTATSPCGPAGSSDLPAVAWHPDHGAIVVSGAGADGNGGSDVGIVGLGPTFR